MQYACNFVKMYVGCMQDVCSMYVICMKMYVVRMQYVCNLYVKCV